MVSLLEEYDINLSLIEDSYGLINLFILAYK